MTALIAPLPVIYVRASGSGGVASAVSKGKKGKSAAGKKKTSRRRTADSARKQTSETSADVRRRQEETQREIRRTQQQIRANDAEIKKSLAELGRLEGDINAGKARVDESARKVNSLHGQISGLQQQISADEKTLARLRAEYLKSVRKMRVKRKSKSLLAFVFSSSSFNEAVRRMRYLRQVSDWRDRRSREITGRVESLKARTRQLAHAKSAHDRALAENVSAQRQLQARYDRQDAIVVGLKRNGQALNAHLTKKQSEANALKGRVASLIAEEQRRAQAEERARAEREERERRAAEQRAREERAMAEARQKLLEEERVRRQEEALTARNEAGSETTKPDNTKAVKAKEEKPKTERTAVSKPAREKPKTGKPERTREEKSSERADVSYAQARRRKPRGRTVKEAPSPDAANSAAAAASGSGAKSAASPAHSGFGGMKGALPRPVAGQFRVISRFGPHSLPDMPGVTYDNPGIDAEVAPGATAQAVYAGKVSGVYVVDGYSTVVIINHGGYYTVYGNIASSTVKAGDSVKQGQALGRLATDSDNPSHSVIHFEVWRNRDKMDPLGWIR